MYPLRNQNKSTLVKKGAWLWVVKMSHNIRVVKISVKKMTGGQIELGGTEKWPQSSATRKSAVNSIIGIYTYMYSRISYQRTLEIVKLLQVTFFINLKLVIEKCALIWGFALFC